MTVPPRRWLIGLGVAAVLVLVALSPSFGRAAPTGSYRPELPPAALTTGCFPLPEGLALTFPHQVRTDGDVATPAGPRRRLVVQYDLVDEAEVRDQLTAAFAAAGFTPVPGPPGPPGALTWSRAGAGAGTETVGVTVTPLDVPDDAVVRGTVVLDLPVVAVASADPVCDDPYSTKRFPPSYEPAA